MRTPSSGTSGSVSTSAPSRLLYSESLVAITASSLHHRIAQLPQQQQRSWITRASVINLSPNRKARPTTSWNVRLPGWRCAMAWAFDLRLEGRPFDSRPFLFNVTIQVVLTHIGLHTPSCVTKQYNFVPVKGQRCLTAGKVTVGLTLRLFYPVSPPPSRRTAAVPTATSKFSITFNCGAVTLHERVV